MSNPFLIFRLELRSFSRFDRSTSPCYCARYPLLLGNTAARTYFYPNAALAAEGRWTTSESEANNSAIMDLAQRCEKVCSYRTLRSSRCSMVVVLEQHSAGTYPRESRWHHFETLVPSAFFPTLFSHHNDQFVCFSIHQCSFMQELHALKRLKFSGASDAYSKISLLLKHMDELEVRLAESMRCCCV